MEGTAGVRAEAVRVAVYWGNTLLNVSQVADPRELTAGEVFGAGITAAGVSPRLKLFSELVNKRSSVELGALTLVAEPIAPATKLPRFSMPDDWSFFKIAAMTGVAMVAVLVAIALTPEDLPTTDDDIIGDTVKIFRTTIAQPKPLPKSMSDALARAKEKEGRAGKPDAPKKQAPKKDSLAKTGGPKLPKVGLLAISDGAAMQKLLAPGNGYEKALAGLTKENNNFVGVGPGNGMGKKDAGGGGGGIKGLEIGGGWTKGRCTENCGPGPGLGFGNLGKNVVIPPSAPKEIIGGLSKDEIQRVVKRHQSEIRYCYETELQKDPTLGGKVAVMFEIDPVGGVGDAKVAESTLNNSTAELCLLSKIRRWKFPEPVGGGVVSVTYPWVFSTAGKED